MTDVRPHMSRTRWGGGRRQRRQSSEARSGRRGRRRAGTISDGLLAPLRRHRLWTALGLVVATVAAATRFVGIGIVPPSITIKPFAHATASTQLVVGEQAAAWATTPDLYTEQYPTRAYALANMVATPELEDYVARAAGLPVSKIGILPPLWSELSRLQQWATGPSRASQIIIEHDPYQISLGVQSNSPPWVPVINVQTQAHTTATAARLATAVGTALAAYLRRLQVTSGVPIADRYGISRLPVTVTPAKTSGLVTVAVFTFVAVFVLWCAALLALLSIVRDLRRTARFPKVRNGASRSSYTLSQD
jgi:hypothetical protein